VPFLRFSKDRRGYESTFLVHPQRAGERETPLLLYWFRTPPHVKVGRGALDEETVRLLEDTHPRVEFDWPRILASRPQLPDVPPEAGGRPARPRRRSEDRQERPATPKAAPRPPAAPPEIVQSRPEPEAIRQEPAQDLPAAVESPPTVTEVVESASIRRKFVRVFDASADQPLAEAAPAPVAEPSPEAGRLSERSASERALGSEQLVRVRGRYAAVMARIARRISDPGLAERLRAIAERANPDSWVTDDEVRAGMEGLDAVYAELVPYVGRRRRRRRPTRGPSAATGSAEAQAAPQKPVEITDHEDDDQDDEPEE
jgi:hypothetical protein